MNVSTRLVSAQEALDYELPQSHWMIALAVEIEPPKEAEKGMIYFSTLHLVNGNGDVVCNCAFHPSKIYVFPAPHIQRSNRHCYCDESVEYLRKIVARLKGKAHE